LEKEPRKASDILLNLEAKVETLLGIVSSQDLTIKVLSNKLNILIQSIDKIASVPQISVEAANVNSLPNIPIFSEQNINIDTAPQGFRRSSRPETFEGDNSYLNKAAPKIQKEKPSEVIVPAQATVANVMTQPDAQLKTPKEKPSKNSIPVMQRIVDKNGKSVFLANVEINDVNGAEVFKTRTNGTGKWMASLVPGNYKIIIRKGESLTKERAESIQDVIVDGTQSPLELKMMILM